MKWTESFSVEFKDSAVPESKTPGILFTWIPGVFIGDRN
jgi:hypothetical protein